MDVTERRLFVARNLQLLSISDYKILRVLGTGCNAIVFLCSVTVNGKEIQVALKMILNTGLPSSQICGTFDLEIQILYRIDIHPNIIHVFHHFSSQPTTEMIDHVDPALRPALETKNLMTGAVRLRNTQFFAIEYHPQTLEQKLVEIGTKMNLEIILKYSLDIIEAILHLFKHKVAHRDVKPNNFLVSSEDRVILSDFGESVLLDDEYCCKNSNLRSGNMQYQAPEITNQRFTASHHTTINFTKQYSWETGCIIYVICTGEVPFPDYPTFAYGTPPNVRVPPPNVPNGHLPPRFRLLLENLLANDPSQRIPIDEAHKEMLQIIQQINPSSVPTPPVIAPYPSCLPILQNVASLLPDQLRPHAGQSGQNVTITSGRDTQAVNTFQLQQPVINYNISDNSKDRRIYYDPPPDRRRGYSSDSSDGPPCNYYNDSSDDCSSDGAYDSSDSDDYPYPGCLSPAPGSDYFRKNKHVKLNISSQKLAKKFMKYLEKRNRY